MALLPIRSLKAFSTASASHRGSPGETFHCDMTSYMRMHLRSASVSLA